MIMTSEQLAFLRESIAKDRAAGYLGAYTAGGVEDLLDTIDASLAEAQRLRDELARRDAVRVEVPENPTPEEWWNMLLARSIAVGIGSDSAVMYAHEMGMQDGIAWARKNARLVPAPPQADAVVVDAEQLAKAYCIALNVPPEELRARMLNDDPVDGHFPNGIPGMFAWRYSLKMAEGIVENLRALAAGGEG